MSRRARMEQTRTQVFDAARSCFRELGFQASTIAAIARRAGVSVGTVHLHFGDKQNLVAAAFHQDLEDVLASAWATLDPQAPAIDQLLHPARLLYTWYAASPELARDLLSSALFLNGPRGDGFDDQVLRFVARQALVIERGQATGELRTDVPAALGAQGFFADYFLTLVSGLRGHLPGVDEQLQLLEALTRARLEAR